MKKSTMKGLLVVTTLSLAQVVSLSVAGVGTSDASRR